MFTPCMPLFSLAPMILSLTFFPVVSGRPVDTDALVITSFAAHRSQSSDTAIPLRLPPGLGQVSLPSLFETLRRTPTGLAHSAHRPDDELLYKAGGEGEGKRNGAAAMVEEALKEVSEG